MKYFTFVLCVLVGASCMKSKEDYRKGIEEIQREEEVMEPDNERARGSNDAEGMGMDE